MADQYDEEMLDAGIASGLDIPTALAAAERDDEPPNRSGCGRLIGLVLLAVGNDRLRFADRPMRPSLLAALLTDFRSAADRRIPL